MNEETTPQPEAAEALTDAAPTAPVGVSKVDSSNFDETISADGPVLVDFWAEWCGPCKMIAPILDELATETDTMRIAKLNVDDASDIARRFDVMSIPTLILFENGEPAKRLVGAKSKGQLAEELAEWM